MRVVQLHEWRGHGRRPGPGRSTRTPTSPPRPCSWSPTGWAATGVVVASSIVVEEFARLADHGYDSTRGTEVVNECLAESQRRIRGVRRSAPRRGRARL